MEMTGHKERANMTNRRKGASLALALFSIVCFVYMTSFSGLGCATQPNQNVRVGYEALGQKPPETTIQEAVPEEVVQSEPTTLEGLYREGTELLKSDSTSKQGRGVAWLTKAAEQGYVPAQMILGIWYGAKDGGRDSYKSLHWYRKAAEQGQREGQWEVGRALYRSGDSEKLKEAIPWLIKAAEQGHGMSHAVLGRCYAEGTGVEKDLEKAILWNSKGADLEVVPCMIWLSMHDPAESKRHDWLLKGARAGDANCQYLAGLNYELGHLVAEDKDAAYEWYEKAAEQGHRDALLKVWWNKAARAWGENNHAEAAKWLRKMVEAGDDNPTHLILLASYEFEQRNLEESFKLYKMAAEKGDASAMYMTGLCYKDGYGVGKDEVASTIWFEKAAEKGDAAAQCEIGVCYNFGNGVKRDFAKAYQWFSKAAAQGSAEGCRRLARCHEYGFGTAKNLDEAAAWYAKAADMGDENAKEWMKRNQTAAATAQKAAAVQKDAAARAKILEAKAKSESGASFVIGGFYIGMPVRDAEELLRYYFPEKKIDSSLKTEDIVGNKHEMMSDGLWFGDENQCFCRTGKDGRVTRLNFEGKILSRFINYGDLSPERWVSKFITENGGMAIPDQIMKFEVTDGKGISIEQPIWRISLKPDCKITYFGQENGHLDEDGDLTMLNYLHFFMIKYVNEEGGKVGTLRLE